MECPRAYSLLFFSIYIHFLDLIQSQSLKYLYDMTPTFPTLFMPFSKSKSNRILDISTQVFSRLNGWSPHYKPLIHRLLPLADGILILPALDSVTPLLKTSIPISRMIKNLAQCHPISQWQSWDPNPSSLLGNCAPPHGPLIHASVQ